MNIKTSKHKKFINMYFGIFIMLMFIIFLSVFLLNKNRIYLDSSLLYIRILNIVLSILSLYGCLSIYFKTEDSIIFCLMLMYLCFSIGIILGNIDFFIFNNKKFIFSNYITISTSLLRIVMLLIAISPNSKLHTYIYKKKYKSIIFVIIYSVLFGIIENIFNLPKIINYIKYFFIIYNLLLIVVYLITSIQLLKFSLKNNIILKFFSISIFLLAIKAILAIYGFFYISFNIKLISLSITSAFFFNDYNCNWSYVTYNNK